MDEIGNLLREARESSGVSLSEASKDLDVKEIVLENVEDGKVGSFKEIYELKQVISDYTKYLGLDSDKIINMFNEYMFEYTSKIPVAEIEKTIELKIKEEPDNDKVLSPYTKKDNKIDKKYIILFFIILILSIALVMTWAIKQVTVGTQTTNVISYNYQVGG